MDEVPLSRHVEADVKQMLDADAELQRSSTEAVAEFAIRRYLELREHERALLRERNAEADRGVFVSEDAVTRWVESWDTDDELPMPKQDVFLPPRR